MNDVDVTWKECRFELWDYNGKVVVPVPALKVSMEVEGIDEPVDQYFSAGSGKDWEPSKDGTKLVSIGSAKGINKTSNFGILMLSLIEANFPKDKIGEDCTVFEGMKCHMIRVAAPKREGIVKAPRADGKVYEDQNLIVDSIISLPWDKKGKATGKTAAQGKETTKPAGDAADKAQTVVMEILGANPKGLDKKKLAGAVFNALKADPDRNEIVKLVYDEEFLGGGPWTYEKGIIGG